MKKILLISFILLIAISGLCDETVVDGTKTLGPIKATTGDFSGNLNVGGTVQGKRSIVTDADGITLTLATHNGSWILMTGAGEVGLWDCSTANIGSYAYVQTRDAAEQVEVVMAGDTTNDLFRLNDGTETGANDEADMGVAANDWACFVCMENNKWYVFDGKGTVADGGAAD